MKIAFLSYNVDVFNSSFSGLALRLQQRGHEVKAFYHPDSKDPELAGVEPVKVRWWNFDLDKLWEFNPDRMIIFNGSFVWCNAATHFLKTNTRAKKYFVELAWLPQANNLFLDPDGPGARSGIYKVHEADINEDPELVKVTMAALRSHYRAPAAAPLGLESGKYIFVPCQVESDTSILYDSPVFKTNHSLVGFVHKHFSKTHKIVVKQHPLDPKNMASEWPDIVWAPKDIPVNDLSAHAAAVIGMNSTTLIEALVHMKPVMCLGLNVACNKGVFFEWCKSPFDPAKLLDWRHNKHNTEQVLTFLRRHQFSRTAPDDWVVSRIERGE